MAETHQLGDLFSVIPFRKCLYSKGCKRPAEFAVYTNPILVPSARGLIPAVVEVHVCAYHLRLQLKEEHEKDHILNIDRLT